MNDETALFDRSLLAHRLDRAAPRAAAHDFLLTRVAEDFAERLSIVKRSFGRTLVIDAYHGVLGRQLRGLPNVGDVIAAGISPALLRQCDGPTVVADAEALPFAEGSLDLVVSGLSLQLANDLPGALVQIRRALKPDGLLLAAILAGSTLNELKQAWLAAEAEVTGGASPRVAPFADVRALGGLLQRAGFALPVADADVVNVTYESPLALMREIKGMGASNVLAARRRVPVPPGLLARASAIYQDRFGLPDGRVAATFEIVTLTGWVPHESQQKPLKPGSAAMRLQDALKGASGSRDS